MQMDNAVRATCAYPLNVHRAKLTIQLLELVSTVVPANWDLLSIVQANAVKELPAYPPLAPLARYSTRRAELVLRSVQMVNSLLTGSAAAMDFVDHVRIQPVHPGDAAPGHSAALKR